jgi:hypothetical protein
LEIAGKLTCRKSLFSVQDKGNSEKPFLKGKMGMVENGLDCDAKGSIAVVTMVTLLFWYGSGILRLAVRAGRLASPPDFFEMVDAIRFGREKFVDSDDVHGYYLLLGLNLAQEVELVKTFFYLKMGHSEIF